MYASVERKCYMFVSSLNKLYNRFMEFFKRREIAVGIVHNFIFIKGCKGQNRCKKGTTKLVQLNN